MKIDPEQFAADIADALPDRAPHLLAERERWQQAQDRGAAFGAALDDALGRVGTARNAAIAYLTTDPKGANS